MCVSSIIVVSLQQCGSSSSPYSSCQISNVIVRSKSKLNSGVSSPFEIAVHGAIIRARSDEQEKVRGADLQSASWSADYQVTTEGLPAETAVDSHSLRGLVGEIVKSKPYTVVIITAVPFSVVAGVLEFLFDNPANSSEDLLVTPPWSIDNIHFWQFVYWFENSLVILFLFDVVLRAFWMGVSNYLMDCICWLDMIVSFLDVVGLFFVIYLPSAYSVVGTFTHGLRAARFLRVPMRSIRFARLVKSAQALEHKPTQSKVEKVDKQILDARYKDSIETESINRTYARTNTHTHRNLFGSMAV